MVEYIIAENDEGLMVVDVPQGKTAEQAAVAAGGMIVDEGPYSHYNDAYDAMQLIPAREDERPI